MSSLSLSGVVIGALALLAPQTAAADCGTRLAQAAQAVGLLSDSVDHRVHDRLHDHYAEAESLVGADERRCLGVVQRMEDLIRSNGGRIGNGRSTSDARPAASGVGSRSSGPSVMTINAPTPFSRTLSSRTASLSAQTRAEVVALSEYIEVLRQVGAELASRSSVPTEDANRAVQATNLAIEASEAVQEILINAEGDQLHAQLEDAFRTFDESQSQWRTQLERSGAPVTAAQRSQMTRALSQLNEVRGRLDRWLLETLGEGRAPGYAAAFLALEARHQREEGRVTAQCDALAEAAQAQMARDYLAGKRDSTALAEAIAQCQAISVPLREEQQREMDELEARFEIIEVGRTRRTGRRARTPEPEDDFLAPLVREDSAADDDFLAPLVREEGPGDDDFLAPLTPREGAPDDDFLAPLVPPASEPSQPAPDDGFLAPLVRPEAAGS